MGCTQTINFYPQTPEAYEHKTVFDKLALNEHDVQKLHKVFVALDANRDGQCDLPEFLQFFELPKDRFTERIFKCMDVSSTGKLDFHDFVVGLWNYCTVTDASLAMMSFDIYDRDSKGRIEYDHMEEMVKDLFGAEVVIDPDLHEAYQPILNWIKNNDPMHVGFDLWHYTVFVEKFPSLLRPIFKLQEELRARSGKLKFWQVATDNRTLVLENGEEATIGGMIMAHTRSAMREKLENGMDSDDESEESEVDEWGLPKEKVGKQDLAQMGCWAARKEVKRRKRKEKAARSRKQGIYDISEVLDMTGTCNNRRNERGLFYVVESLDYTDPKAVNIDKLKRRKHKERETRRVKGVQKLKPTVIKVLPKKKPRRVNPDLDRALAFDFFTTDKEAQEDPHTAMRLQKERQEEMAEIARLAAEKKRKGRKERVKGKT